MFPPAYITATTTAASCFPSRESGGHGNEGDGIDTKAPGEDLSGHRDQQSGDDGRVPAVHSLAASAVLPAIENAKPEASAAMATAIRARVHDALGLHL